MPISILLLLTACSPAAQPIIPTDRPTHTPTLATIAPESPPASPTHAETPTPAATGGPSPTPLLGPTRTPEGALGLPTRPANPNAPVIEFFRASPEVATPGGSFTLFWSTRNVTEAAIYRLDAEGQRTLVYNVEPYGRQTITLSARERVQVAYELAIGAGAGEAIQRLVIPLACPVPWFFAPAPDSCPIREASATPIIEQPFERGRMFFIEETRQIYVLFNDGSTPRWNVYDDRYNPAIHAERDPAFDQAFAGTGLVQPVARLGYLWRGLDTVRNRLGSGLAPEQRFEGLRQTAPTRDPNYAGREDVFITASDGTVIQLLPNGSQWQILTPSR